MRAPAWWTQLVELNRRANDERTRAIQIVAAKDAFIAVITALMIVSLVAFTLPDDRAQRLALAVMPLVVMFVGGTTFLISFRLRGGGYEARLVNARIGVLVVGSIVGLAIAFGILRFSGATISPAGLVGQVAGAAIAVAVIYVVMLRAR